MNYFKTIKINREGGLVVKLNSYGQVGATSCMGVSPSAVTFASFTLGLDSHKASKGGSAQVLKRE